MGSFSKLIEQLTDFYNPHTRAHIHTHIYTHVHTRTQIPLDTFHRFNYCLMRKKNIYVVQFDECAE